MNLPQKYFLLKETLLLAGDFPYHLPLKVYTFVHYSPALSAVVRSLGEEPAASRRWRPDEKGDAANSNKATGR